MTDTDSCPVGQTEVEDRNSSCFFFDEAFLTQFLISISILFSVSCLSGAVCCIFMFQHSMCVLLLNYHAARLAHENKNPCVENVVYFWGKM